MIFADNLFIMKIRRTLFIINNELTGMVNLTIPQKRAFSGDNRQPTLYRLRLFYNPNVRISPLVVKRGCDRSVTAVTVYSI